MLCLPWWLFVLGGAAVAGASALVTLAVGVRLLRRVGVLRWNPRSLDELD